MQLNTPPPESRTLRNRHNLDIRDSSPRLEQAKEPSSRREPTNRSKSAESSISTSSNVAPPIQDVESGYCKDSAHDSGEIDELISCLSMIGNCFVASESPSITERTIHTGRLFLAVLVLAFVMLSYLGGTRLVWTEMQSTSKFVANMFAETQPSLPIVAMICTHHRSGTVLFQAVGEKVCEEFLLDFERIEDPFKLDQPELTETLLFLRYYSATEKMVVGMHGFSEICRSGDNCRAFDVTCRLSSCNATKPRQGEEIPLAHVVRDPVEVLISGYLYHQQNPPPEEWLAKPKPDALIILNNQFQEQFKSMPYFRVLQELPPNLGLRVEYMVEMDDLFRMARNYRDLRNEDYALNVKFEDVKTNYSGTMKMILGHLGLIEKFGEQELMQVASKLDLNSMSKKVQTAYQVDKHVTEGKHDKQALREVLYQDKDMRPVLESLASMLDYPNVFQKKSTSNQHKTVVSESSSS